MEEVGGSQPAGEFTVEPGVCGVEGIGDADLGGDGLSGFVDAEAEEPGVGVGVDEPGGDVEACGVDVLIGCDAWCGAGAEFGDLAVVDEDPCVVEDAGVGLCPDGGVGEQEGFGFGCLVVGEWAQGGSWEVGEEVRLG